MKNKGRKSNRIWSLAIVLCLLLAAGCLIFTSVLGNLPRPKVEKTVAATPEVSLAPEPETSAEPTDTPAPNPITRSTSPAALAKTGEAGADYIDGIYFLGDKALKTLSEQDLLTGEERTQQVWCPGGGVLDLNMLGTVTFRSPVTGNDVPAAEIVEVNHPKTVILLPSADNANLLTETTLKAALNTLISGILAEDPETHIILSSLTPIAATYAYEDVTIEVINRVNGWIAAAAESNGVKYLDAAFELAGTDGFLPENYHNGDGMHLSAEGLKAWFECVKTHPYAG